MSNVPQDLRLTLIDPLVTDSELTLIRDQVSPDHPIARVAPTRTILVPRVATTRTDPDTNRYTCHAPDGRRILTLPLDRLL